MRLKSVPGQLMEHAVADDLQQAAIDLFRRARHGHLGDFAYLDGGGSLYHRAVVDNPNHYPFHGEIAHIEATSKTIVHHVEAAEHVVVVGGGPIDSFAGKDWKIIRRLKSLRSIDLIDANPEFNRTNCSFIQNQRGDLSVSMKEGDFRHYSLAGPVQAKTLVISTGSLIGNISDAPIDRFPAQKAIEMLTAFRRLAGVTGYVVVGYDTKRDVQSLARAYRPIADFIVNIMQVIASRCHGLQGFNAGAGYFGYRMSWHHRGAQVAHNVEVLQDQSFSINDEPFRIRCGDLFIVMSSVKPSVSRMSKLNIQAGLATIRMYRSPGGIVEHVSRVSAVSD